MISISNPSPAVPEDNARHTKKENIKEGLVRTACAVAGIALLAINLIAAVAIAGATVFGVWAIGFTIVASGGATSPLLPLAIPVILVAGFALGCLISYALMGGGGLLIAKAVTGSFPDLSNMPTHQNRYDGFNWNPG